MKTETTTPSSNPKLALSNCCNADVVTHNLTIFQKVNGDFKKYCSFCGKECTYEWYPVYKLVSKGTYRKIVYKPVVTLNQ